MRELVNESQLWQKRATGSNRNSNIQECYRVCFQSTSNSSGEETSSGTLIEKKDCAPDDEVFISARQSQKDGWFRLDSFSSVIIRALKGSYFLRFVVQDMLTLQALWVEEKRGEG